MGHNTAGFLWTINLYLPLEVTKKRNLKVSFFSRKQLKLLETESLAKVQFVFDSCRFVSQSNYLNNIVLTSILVFFPTLPTLRALPLPESTVKATFFVTDFFLTEKFQMNCFSEKIEITILHFFLAKAKA